MAQGSGSFVHAQTFSHHPVSCAAGVATMKYLKQHKLVERCAQMGRVLHERLRLLADLPHVGDVRGRGLLAGIEFVEDKGSRAPFPRSEKFAERFADAALAAGITGWPNVGHADGRSGDAAARFLHICGSDFYYESFAALCERLAQLAPGPSKKRVFLSNSGTEAVEGAIKLARHSTGRPAIIGFLGAFHGRSYGALSLTASKAVQRSGFAPFLPEIHHVPYAYRYRCAYCPGESERPRRRTSRTRAAPALGSTPPTRR